MLRRQGLSAETLALLRPDLKAAKALLCDLR
jgi:hypothetical protein